MLDIKNPVHAYEVFKLQWMIEQGATLSDLVHNLQLMLDENLDGADIPTSLQSLFSDLEFGFGFDGAIRPCYQEFLEHDYPLMMKSSMK